MKKRAKKNINNVLYYICVIAFVCVAVYLIFTLIPLEDKNEKYVAKKHDLTIGNSAIQGNGLFTKKYIANGEIIIADIFRGNCPYNLIKNGNNTIKNDYFKPYLSHINHCTTKDNSTISYKNGKYNLIAIKDIVPGDEITSNYDKVNNQHKFIDTAKSGYVNC